MARTRPLPVILLGVAVVGVVATAVSPSVQDRLDRPAREQARSVAQALPAPVGADDSTACHGDGLVSCWESSGSVADVTRELSAAMGELARVEPTSSCDGARISTDSCFVRGRFKTHGAFAFVDPRLERDAATGTMTVTGSVVSVSAN